MPIGQLFILLTIILRHISAAFVENPYPLVFAFFFATWTELEAVDHLVEVMDLDQHLAEQIASTAPETQLLVAVEKWVVD